MKNPHDILDEVFPLEKYDGYIYIRKSNIFFNIKNPIVRVFLGICWNFKWLLKICFRRLTRGKEDYLFREYDITSLLLMFIPFKCNIIFNVNHNLSTRYGVIITKIIDFRYEVLMLDGGKSLRFKYPNYTFERSTLTYLGQGGDERRIVIFLGSRPEQKDFLDDDVLKLISILNNKYNVITCGRNYGNKSFYKDEDLIKLLNNSIGIVLFGRKYLDRHSGSVWTASQYCSSLLIPNNDVFIEQSVCNKNKLIYNSFSEIEEIIKNLADRDIL